MKQGLLALWIIFSAITAVSAQRDDGIKGFILIPKGFLNGKEVKQFYISRTEVSNVQYREFIDALRAAGDTARLKAAMPDTTLWRQPVYNEPYVHYYFQHKAYDNYPVVGVSKRGAYLYCEWLTQKFKKGGKALQASLPAEAQWEYAAKGGDSTAVYPWEGNSVRYQKKGKLNGTYLCNFAAFKDPSHGPIDTTKFNPNADVTAPVVSYLPNGYGLSDMSGNVAEMISGHDYTKGGSYFSSAEQVKITAHEDFNPSKGGSMVGFRPIVW